MVISINKNPVVKQNNFACYWILLYQSSFLKTIRRFFDGYERIDRKYRLTFYIDERSKRVDGRYIVKPVGKSSNGYYYICCPHCQQFEAVHKDEIKKGKLIKSRCSNNCSNIPNRILAYQDKETGQTKIIKIKQDVYYIDLEGWCN